MNGAAAAAVSVLTRPIARIPEATRRRVGLLVLVVFALGFPIFHPNDADVDSMANAAAGDKLKVLARNDLKEDVNATPAIVDGKLYIRTDAALYAFGE